MLRSAIVILFVIVVDISALELINANSNSNRFENGAVVSTLSGNVEFLWNDTRIFSDQTVWRRGSGHLTMSGNIKVLREKQELRCNSAEFYSTGKILYLRGNVFGIDSNYRATMFSERADYFVKNDSVFLSQNPIIHFWEFDSADTVTITGKDMNYTSVTGIARADKNVKITGTDVVSFADTGYYFADTRKGMLVGNKPRIEYDNSTVKGDTIHVIFGESALDEFYVVGSPIAKSREENDGDSVFMELSGDTLRFLIKEQKISQILSERNAFFQRFRHNNENLIDKMWGNRILTFLDYEDCEGCNILSVVEGNAKAIYFDNKTKNESSGDTLKLFFDDNGVTRVIISGKVKGRVTE